MGFRLDSGSGEFGKAERTPQGGLRIPAFLTRTGIFEYRRADGSVIRELRPEEEVFRSDSLATLVAAPVTKRHPSELITPKNFSSYSRGNVGDEIVRDGARVAAHLYVQDGDLLSAVERRDMQEISCGYRCDIDETPGTFEGKPYDRVQRNIRYNHVAILEKGRAGSDISLRLDSNGDEVIPLETGESKVKIMKFERIDGVEYEIGTPAHAKALENQAKIKALETEKAKAEARADVAETGEKDAKAKLAEAQDPKRLDAAVAERVKLIEAARTVLGVEEKFDGKSVDEIRRAVVAKAYPDKRLDGKHEAYVEGLFDSAIAKAVEGDLGDLRSDAIDAPRLDGDDEDDEKSRLEMIKRNRTAWKPSEKASA
jgi:hypothetical protein